MAEVAQFSTNGGRWTETSTSSGDWTSLLGDTGGVIGWSIVGAGVSDATGLSMFTGQTVEFYDIMTDDHFAALHAAFNTWAQAGNIDFILLPDSGGDIGTGDYPTIRISVADIDGANGTLGQAIFPDASAAGGDIVFDSGDGAFFADTNSFYLTALHEIGHALGLDHETTNTAIMNPTINTSLTGLQNDDIDGIQTIYGAQDFGPNVFHMEPTQVHLTIHQGPSNLTLVGNTLDNRMTGSLSGEILQGNGGNDNINGRDGDDQLFGGAGNDQLVGGTGADTMAGGTGNDHYFIDGTSGDVVSEGVARTRVPTPSTRRPRRTRWPTTSASSTSSSRTAPLTSTATTSLRTCRATPPTTTCPGGGGNDLLNGNGGATRSWRRR